MKYNSEMQLVRDASEIIDSVIYSGEVDHVKQGIY